MTATIIKFHAVRPEPDPLEVISCTMPGVINGDAGIQCDHGIGDVALSMYVASAGDEGIRFVITGDGGNGAICGFTLTYRQARDLAQRITDAS